MVLRPLDDQHFQFDSLPYWYSVTHLSIGINNDSCSYFSQLERMYATFSPFRHLLLKKKIFGAAVLAVLITAGFILIVTNLKICVAPFFEITYFSFPLLSFLIVIVSYLSTAKNIGFGNQLHHHGTTIKKENLPRRSS